MTHYRVCSDRDLPDLKHLWLSCFEEREEAAALFFQRNKATFHAYACEADDRIVSALYLIDGTLGGVSAHYLCGAATLPAYRRRGYMSALIAFAMEDAKQRGDRYSLLFPASDPLYNYYKNFGYLPACAVKHAEFDTDTERNVCGGLTDLQTLQKSCSKGKALLWSSDFIRFAADYYGCYGAKTVQSADAFAFYQPDGDAAEVYYALYSDIEALKALLKAEGIKRFRLTGAADDPLFDSAITKPYGMILSLCGDTAPENVCIGITLQ